MNRRIVSVVGAIAGLIVIVLAVCSATVWRPSSTAQASLPTSPTQRYVYIEPGVLGMVDADVTVTASASGQPVTIAVGYSADAAAWLAQDPYLAVTGLKDWSTLATSDVTEKCPAKSTATATPSAEPSASTTVTASAAEATASASASPSAAADEKGCVTLTNSGANPAGADIWQLSKTGKGSLTVDLDATDPDLVMVIATDGSKAAPQVTLSWHRSVSTPWLVPLLILGGLLILAGVFGFLLDIQMRKADEERRRRAAERAARLAAADSVTTVGIPRVGDPNRPLTRREMREKERAEKAGEVWIDPRLMGPSPAKQEDRPVAEDEHGGVDAPESTEPQADSDLTQEATDQEAQASIGERADEVTEESVDNSAEAPAEEPSDEDAEASVEESSEEATQETAEEPDESEELEDEPVVESAQDSEDASVGDELEADPEECSQEDAAKEGAEDSEYDSPAADREEEAADEALQEAEQPAQTGAETGPEAAIESEPETETQAATDQVTDMDSDEAAASNDAQAHEDEAKAEGHVDGEDQTEANDAADAESNTETEPTTDAEEDEESK